MRAFLLHIPEDRLDELKRLSALTGAPVAGLIRRAVDGMLNSGHDNLYCSGFDGTTLSGQDPASNRRG